MLYIVLDVCFCDLCDRVDRLNERSGFQPNMASATVGKPHSYKKLRKRREKNVAKDRIRLEKYANAAMTLNDGVARTRCAAPMDRLAAYAAVSGFQFLKSKLLREYPQYCVNNSKLGMENDKKLVKFFSQISLFDVKEAEVSMAADAYLFDKFESRAESMFLLLCYALVDTDRREGIKVAAPKFFNFTSKAMALKTQSFEENFYDKKSIKVASVGGACGNDLFGAILFLSSFAPNLRAIQACSFDFSMAWQMPCHLINGIVQSPEGARSLRSISKDLTRLFIPEQEVKASIEACEKRISLDFAQCNLKMKVCGEVNERLLNCAETFGMFLFSYVVYESNACKYELLPELLRRSKPSSIFIFLDLHRQTIDEISQLISGLSPCKKANEAVFGSNGFEIIRCLSSSVYPFKGLIAYKTG